MGYKRSDLSKFSFDAKDWKSASGGKTCLATRKSDGVKVFIKQYTITKEPVKDASTSAALYTKKMQRFERMVEIRSKINSKLRSVSGRGGNIIIPYDEFVCDHLYTEVAEFIDGLMTPEEILELDYEDKKKFAATAVNALQTVHNQGIIHIDIKPPNVIAIRNTGSLVIASGKIIDFDNSLLKDLPIPSETGGDLVFQSPELAYYGMVEGDEEIAKLISEKTDVFSMGITLHYYLSGGKMPGYTDIQNPEMKKTIEEKEARSAPVYPWEVVLGDGTLVMDPALPEKMAAILADMTVGEPGKRPTCREVFERIINDDEDEFKPPRPVDAIEWVIEKMKSDGYTGIQFSRKEKQYELLKRGAVMLRMTVPELKKKGYAIPASAGDGDSFEPLDPTTGYVIDEAKLRGLGYTGMHPAGDGRYNLTQNGETRNTFDLKQLVAKSYVKHSGTGGSSGGSTGGSSGGSTVTTPPSFENPDPSDGILRWDIDKLTKLGYTGIKSLGGGQYGLYSGTHQQGSFNAQQLIKKGYAIGGHPKVDNTFDPPDPADGISAWNDLELRKSGYTGIRSIGGGEYQMIINGRVQSGTYGVDKLIRLGYAIPK